MSLHENSRELATEFPYHEVDEEPAPQAGPAHHAETLEFGRRLVSYIRGQDRARLTVDCLYLALGDAELEAETMTAVAAKHGITKAAVSKRVAKITADLHLPPTANNKSTHASKRYSLTNRSPVRLDAPRVRAAPQRSSPPGQSRV